MAKYKDPEIFLFWTPQAVAWSLFKDLMEEGKGRR